MTTAEKISDLFVHKDKAPAAIAKQLSIELSVVYYHLVIRGHLAPRGISPDQMAEIWELRQRGKYFHQIAAILGLSEWKTRTTWHWMEAMAWRPRYSLRTVRKAAAAPVTTPPRTPSRRDLTTEWRRVRKEAARVVKLRRGDIGPPLSPSRVEEETGIPEERQEELCHLYTKHTGLRAYPGQDMEPYTDEQGNWRMPKS